MKNQSPDRLEIFLALALDRAAKRKKTIENSAAFSTSAADDFMLAANSENTVAEPLVENTAADFPALAAYLSAPETERFRLVLADYQSKTDAEQADWHKRIREKIGTDEQLIDEPVHRSHINEALTREIPAVQRIVAKFLPPSYKKSADTYTNKKKKGGGSGDLAQNFKDGDAPLKKSADALEKIVRRTFAGQFVSLRDLQKPTAFDRLNGAQLARLIRLNGIREVAAACVRIEAVESVAAFLRIFSAEDAQAVATQLNNLAKISEARLTFAEQLVQTTLETESQPSAMLDLLGIRLIGIALCRDAPERVRYTNQKLPLEIAPKLPEIIAEQCRETPEDLQRQISAEIERLAETLLRARSDKKTAETRKSAAES